jgi:hypothetical protein
MGSVFRSVARSLATAGLILAVGSPMAARAQSVLQCQLISKSSGLEAANYAADITGGYLRLLLLRSNDPTVASSVYGFEPFTDHRSVYAEQGESGHTDPEFWMATVEASGQVLIDYWEISGTSATHEYLKLQCPSRAP